MAYAAAETRKEHRLAGRRCFTITIVETGVTGDTHEWSVTNLPHHFTITDVHCILTAGDGSATTIDPDFGEFSGTTTLLANATPAASVYNRALDAHGMGGAIYGKSKANGSTGTTGNITTTLAIAEGHY